MSEKKSIRDNALLILGELIEAKTVGGYSQLQVGSIMQSLGMSEEEFWRADSFLAQQGFVKGTFGGTSGIRWVTAAGVEYYESSKHPVPTIQIGAIIQGSVENSQIQAIANAVDSTVRQVVENTSSEDFRRIIAAAIEDMVQAVKGELNADEFSEYLRLAKDFQKEIARETSDKSVLRCLLSSLSFLADVEGAVSFGDRALRLAERVLPYVALIVSYLNRL